MEYIQSAKVLDDVLDKLNLVNIFFLIGVITYY